MTARSESDRDRDRRPREANPLKGHFRQNNQRCKNGLSCETGRGPLDLEFCIGPPRDERPVDAERLERALETTERTLTATGTATGRTMGLTDKARAVAAVYDLVGEGRGQAHTRRVVSLIEAVARGRPVHRSAAAER